MPKRDPRTLPTCDVHWWDAFNKSGHRLGEAIRDASLINQVTTGRVSKRTKKVIQVVTSAELECSLDDADCDYTNIPSCLVFKVEKHKKEH